MVNAQVATVQTGSRVRIRTGDAEEDWTVVAPYESDALKQRLSELSPLGCALLGHRVGEQVSVHGPGGRWTVTVLGIE